MPANRHKPLLLVDVDGVISLFGPGLDVARTAGRWLMVDGHPHFLSKHAGDHLRDLAADFELVWCTGWEERANDHLPRVLRLPGPLPNLTFEGEKLPAAHWKLAGIDAHAGPDRPLAWIDDAFSADCHDWARRRPGPTLLVPTDPARGLTDAEARRLRDWARGLAAAP